MQKTSLSFFKNAKVQLGCKDFFGRAYSFKHIKINFEKKYVRNYTGLKYIMYPNESRN